MRYYAAKSAHGSESSHGFANDTIVMVFSSRSARNEYVDTSSNISAVAITRDVVTSHAANWSMSRNEMIRPQPFTEEFWGIVERDIADDTPGFVGTIEVCGGMYGNEWTDRFYS